MRLAKIFLKRAGLAILGIVLALIVAEIGFRIFSPQTSTYIAQRQIAPFVGFADFANPHGSEPEPAGYERGLWAYRYRPTHTIQNLEERGDLLLGSDFADLRKMNPKEAKRLFVVGASSALGDGASQMDGRVHVQLEKMLNEKEPGAPRPWKVRPAAVRAFISSQERILLELYVLPSQPETIVFLHGFNDAGQLEFGTRPGDPYDQGSRYLRDESFFFDTMRRMSNWSVLASRFTMKSIWRELWTMQEFYAKDPEGSRHFALSSANIYHDNMLKMARRCSQEKVRCLFVFQPYQYASPPDDLQMVVRRISTEVLNLRAQAPMPPGTAFLDLHDFFDGDQARFVDTVHLDDEGQRLEAEKIVEALLKKF